MTHEEQQILENRAETRRLIRQNVLRLRRIEQRLNQKRVALGLKPVSLKTAAHEGERVEAA